MEITAFQSHMQQYFCDIEMKLNEPMSRHTSFRIGGEAEVMLFPKSENQMAEAMKRCTQHHIKPRILGAGTNILAPDEGIRGAVICLKDCLGGLEQTGEKTIVSMAGVTMTRLAMFAANHSLSGLEFAHGIPGTVGGGVYMNAGAYGGEIGDVCSRVWVMNSEGEVRILSKGEMDFSYRHSVLEDTNETVVKAEFVLQPSDSEMILENMRQLQKKRLASQPLDLPSAGSAFKRPTGGYAAALIDGAGLKGYRVGNAGISEKHAGFAVNLGGATAGEMKQLLNEVSDKVYAFSGIRLEPEIRIW